MLDIEKIVEDVMSFPGCRVAVYLDFAKCGNRRNMAIDIINELRGKGVRSASFRDCSFDITIADGGKIYLLDLRRGVSRGMSFYRSHMVGDLPAGSALDIIKAVKSRNTQQKPDDKEYVITSKEHAALRGINKLVDENPWFFAPQELGTLLSQVALNKLTESIETDKTVKIEEVPTFDGHPLVVGMVFEHEGEQYTICGGVSKPCFFLRRNSDRYDHVFGYTATIRGVFCGQQETFKLVSIPVKKGKFYDPGERFLENEDGAEYILVSLHGVRALVSIEDGCNYSEPTETVSGIFGGDEKNFSLLAAPG